MNKIEACGDYPFNPGYRESSTGETAKDAAAAAALKAPRHMDIILKDIVQHGPSTPKEVSERTGLLHQSCRARCSQMGKLRKLQDSGSRRPDVGGKPAIVWEVCNG